MISANKAIIITGVLYSLFAFIAQFLPNLNISHKIRNFAYQS